MTKNKKNKNIPQYGWGGDLLNNIDNILSAPARAATWAVTGALTGKPKYEDPSEALGIDGKKHPYLKLATDIALDPTNLLGVGLVTKAGKLAKGAKILKATDTVIADLSRGEKLIMSVDKAAKASNDAQKAAKILEKTNSGVNVINHTLPNLLLETKFQKAIELGAKDGIGAVAIINDLINQKETTPQQKVQLQSQLQKLSTDSSTKKKTKVGVNKTTTNFESRIQNPVNKIVNSDGTSSTHKMMSFEVDGRYLAAPTIVEINGKLTELSPKDAVSYALKNKEYKEFKTNKEAEDYANNGYKKGTPLENYKNTVQNTTQKIQNKGNPLNDFLEQKVKTINGMKTYKRKDRNSEWIEQQKYGGKIKKLALGGEAEGGMDAGSIVSGVGNSLDALGQFIPVDNDGFGISRKGQKISSGIQTGLGAAADVANNFGPIGKMVGGALKIGQFLGEGITKAVDAIKQIKRPTDELVSETYSPTHKESAMSFGNLDTLSHMALGGQTQSNPTTQNFKQYKAPSHDNGGQMIDKNNNPTPNQNKAVAEIEKKENSYKDYVFSHDLGFAKLAQKINKKYKDREDPISKNSLDIELTELMKKNEKVKAQIQQSQQLAQTILEYGGPIKNKKAQNDFYNELEKYGENRKQELFQNSQSWVNPQIPVNLSESLYPNITYNINAKKIKYGRNNDFNMFSNENVNMIPKADLGLKLLNDLTNVNKDKIELDEYMADNNGVSVPVPNKDFSKLNIPSNSTFNLGEIPDLPSDEGKDDLPEVKSSKKQISPEAVAGFGIKGLEMAAHLAQILKKPDYVKPVYNPEENTIKNKMADRKVDSQSILDAINLEENAGKQTFADNSSSVGVRNANMQKLHANAINSIAKTKMKEQQLNNQYRGEEANMLNTLGTQKMQAQVYAENVNAMSKANVQMQRDKFLKESVGGLGDYLLKKDAVNKENQFQVNILKEKGINFTINDDWKAFSKAGIDITKFDGELESETDKEKRKILLEKNAEKLKPYISKEGYDAFLNGYTNKYLK